VSSVVRGGPASQKKKAVNRLSKPSKATGKKSTPEVKAKSINKAAKLPLEADLLRNMYDLMIRSRVLEERLIKIYKQGQAFFWIGGPGEEAFGVPLGLLAKKGQGPQYDWLHLHYRGTPTLIAMGMEMIDGIRLIMNRATDPCTGGRNFSNHYCFPKWNIAPVTSPIEVQYTTATGTARVQKRLSKDSITIVTGGDAGSAEGDFASCLIWASRPGNELPMLITVQNNRWGISTSYDEQHGEKFVADRGKAFGIRTSVINGNDPIETYQALEEEMYYIRRNRKPVLLEANVSRLYGHSSASGANFSAHEECCIKLFEEKLLRWGVIKKDEPTSLREQYDLETQKLVDIVREEPVPSGHSIWDHVYVNNENADWRKF
jgi:2-oxoisovalerate dehydrogenase E1 component alpha subunit